MDTVAGQNIWRNPETGHVHCLRKLPLPIANDQSHFRELVEFARSSPLAASEVAELATCLAQSGETLDWDSEQVTADIASTGGPGSLSTLLAPILLRADGFQVVKLAVPGRPAGAIDSLGTLPGYRVHMAADHVRTVVARCGFAHFLADATFAPLDAALFAFRHQVGALAVPGLVAASLLAKKLAVGVRVLGLDVRVGVHGNFGDTSEQARENSSLFCTAARVLGIEAVAFVSPANYPPQPWIGRGEGLVGLAQALGLLREESSDPWLAEHVRMCWQMATTVSSVARLDSATQSSPPPIATSTAVDAFFAHLEAQGATVRSFLDRVDAVLSAKREAICVDAAGTLEIDLAALRSALASLQESASTGGEFTDPAGVRLIKRPGSAVAAGEVVALVRCASIGAEALLARVHGAFSTTKSPIDQGSKASVQLPEVIRA